MIETPSPNFEPRPAGAPIDTLVLHYTGMQSAKAALDRLADPAAKVSAHYLVDEDGTTHRLVDEAMRAWHAGLAYWRGAKDINSRSIGIEIVNPGHEFGYRRFPEAQMAAVIELSRSVLSRHPIAPRNVVGHSDIAPTRKQDPGELFDWAGLSRAGIGLWIGEVAGIEPDHLIADLATFGYDTADPAAAITAFQRHFRPDRVDGLADPQCAGLARALCRAVGA